MADHIAQSFYIDVASNIEGVFLTGIDLYFKRKDPSRGIVVELRTVDKLTGQITSAVLPYSTIYVPNSSIYVSTTTGNIATRITFKSPVFVKNKTDYAFVVMPEGNSPYFDIWCAKLGENDLATGRRVSQQPASGVMFASSNSRTWTVIQEMDIKYKLYRAVFSTTTTGSLLLTNSHMDYFTVSDPTGYGQVGETVYGEQRFNLSSVTGTFSVGHSVVHNTTGAIGEITYKSGSAYRIKLPSGDATLLTAGAVSGLYANGASTGASATASSVVTPTGRIFFRNPINADDYKIHISNSTGNFIAGEQLIGETSNASCTIVSVDDLQMNLADIEVQKMDFATTSSTWTARTTSSSDALSGWYGININDNNEFTNERKVASRTNEVSNMSSSKSLQVRGLLKTYNNYLSPVVNINRSHSIIIANIINNDSGGETGVSGGNAWARHITRKVTLADGQDAEDLKLYLTAYWPSGTTVKAYYKVLNAEDSDTLESIAWTEMDLSSKFFYSLASNKKDFKEYEFKIPDSSLTGSNGEVQYTNSEGVTFTGFKYFIFKVVLLSPNTALIPRLKDLRAIALQL